jgi:hypothetical protein
MTFLKETIATATPRAARDCGRMPKLAVRSRAAGFCIGTVCDCGPSARESGHYPLRARSPKRISTAAPTIVSRQPSRARFSSSIDRLRAPRRGQWGAPFVCWSHRQAKASRDGHLLLV